MKKQVTLLLLFFIFLQSGIAQTTYLPLGTEEYQLIDRLETFSGRLSTDFSGTLKPIARKDAVSFLSDQKQHATYAYTVLTKVDQYNVDRALSISGEWVTTPDGDDGAAYSKKPILKYFYRRPADMLHFNTSDFFLVVNPVLYIEGMSERNQDGLKYVNTRGVEVRGRILDRLGFYTMLADNQEKLPSYMQRWEAAHQAFPGGDYYHHSGSKAYDVFLARGYFDFNAFKDHLNVTFGYDNDFIGDGMRSLFLSNTGAAATFLRLRSRFWKLHYENLFMELTNDYTRSGDRRLPKKYAAMHQLNMNLTQWLNLGVFESTVFYPDNKFRVDYLVPIIFYQSLARALGGDHKSAIGINFKAVALRRLQLYGQAYFDRLQLSDLGKGSWENQYGLQLGIKYFDAFTLRNLDIQGEANIVRPFTYASDDAVTDYTHYNQPLAHPFESSFAEFIGIARYQPVPKLLIAAKAIYAIRGTDSNDLYNYGNDIFKPTDTRSYQDQYGLISGERLNSLYLNLNISYEIRPNIYLEAGGSRLQGKYENGLSMPSSTCFYGGIRMNIARKEYDYY